ncbi:hypothetical protein H6P81_003870 [Aristolochia fimbriata]|uniref:Auxin-responsive protein n=1 Tax=Aristolochia fimbriata TaxID=158543 RepID=A0AAV7FHG5_ARIFI|nr:hypothetical protein H6P81_003870 [Aristolochia fimbriata]
MEGLEITELRLGLPGVLAAESGAVGKKKRAFAEMNVAATAVAEDENSSSNDQRSDIHQSTKSTARVIGWPPVCSYRQKNNNNNNSTSTSTTQAVADKKKMKFYVKVSMDGAPYLRKVDLAAYRAYSDLSKALKELFGCFRIGGRLSGEDESEYSEYVTIYEDREGDWMLVGDVPWEMFTDSCKRLRIMKGSEAKGFQSLQHKSSPALVDQRTSRQHA